jgi:hypothetical protein
MLEPESLLRVGSRRQGAVAVAVVSDSTQEPSPDRLQTPFSQMAKTVSTPPCKAWISCRTSPGSWARRPWTSM